jgi:hypothetical protein
VEEALERSNEALVFSNESKDGMFVNIQHKMLAYALTFPELISNYMNGPRIVFDSKLSVLIISTREGEIDQQKGSAEYDLLMCAPHFTGDGTSLHQSTHELLTMLASKRTDEQLLEDLYLSADWADTLPPAFEHRCAVPKARLAKAATKVIFLLSMEREIVRYPPLRS